MRQKKRSVPGTHKATAKLKEIAMPNELEAYKVIIIPCSHFFFSFLVLKYIHRHAHIHKHTHTCHFIQLFRKSLSHLCV